MHTVLSYYTREEHLKKEFLNGLQQRRVDEKFSYIGERQANSWFNLCKSDEYTYYKNSKLLLKHYIKDLVSSHKGDVNVIAFGPGDGLKEELVVKAFLERQRASLFFVDVSRDILNVAIENMRDNDVLKEIFVADLKNFVDIKDISHHVKKSYNGTNFFTLLGNTLGNYPQAMILKTFRSSMAPGDKILIDVNVKIAKSSEEEAAQIDEMIQGYDDNPAFQERNLALLSEAHIEAADGSLEVEFTRDEFFPQMSVLKQYFRFSRSKTISYQGEDVYFAKGERILIHYSNKYTFESLENILTSHGLHIIKYAKDDTGRYCLILCELG